MVSNLCSELAQRGLALSQLLYQAQEVQIYTVIDTVSHEFVLKAVRYSINFPYETAIRELNMNSALTHPHVIKFYTHFWFYDSSATWVLAMVLEKMSGDLMKEIDARASQGRYWTEEELLGMIRDLVAALAYMQKQGLAHRDIKPQNILYDNLTVKLGDFGSSKATFTYLSHSVAGTPFFLSPLLKLALLSNSPILDHNPYKSDVFSLGLVILTMCELAVPTSICSVIQLQQNTDMELSRIGYSDTIKDLLRSMLKGEESERPDFRELEERLGGGGEREECGFKDYVGPGKLVCKKCGQEGRREYFVPEDCGSGFLCLGCCPLINSK